MSAPIGFETGFCFSAFAADERTKAVVNVCGHDSVGMPLARSMDPVNEAYIEQYGLDNLIVPISVSEPKKCSSGEYDYIIDVVVHSCLTKRCGTASRMQDHLVMRLTALSIEWVQRECGIRLLEKRSQLIGAPYYHGSGSQQEKLADLLKMATQMLSDEKCPSSKQTNKEGDSDAPRIPSELHLSKTEEKPKKLLVQEVIANPGIKKGFLCGQSKLLYGPQGSTEGNGKAPDPLGHIPESLKSRCQIIDTRNMSAEGVVSSVSGAPLRHAEERVGICAAAAAPSDWVLKAIEPTNSSIILRYAVPDSVQGIADVDLSASDDSVEVDGHFTKLPQLIDADAIKAKYVKSRRELVVTCPVKAL